ncbi:leucine-rich repeat protein, partial [Bacillus pumilus]
NAQLSSVVIPETVEYNGTAYTVTALGDSAFYGNGYLTALKIPETVTVIKSCAISQTLRLFELRLPNSVTEVEPRGV